MTSRRFTIILATDADPDPDVAVRRLRSILKALGRSYGIRCLSAVEVTSEPPASQESDR